MNIVNKKNFIQSIIVILAVLICTLFLFMKVSLSHTEINYKKMVVIRGDSLWSIAKYEKENNAYYKEKEIREIIAEIKSINQLKSSNLFAGQELNIPTI